MWKNAAVVLWSVQEKKTTGSTGREFLLSSEEGETWVVESCDSCRFHVVWTQLDSLVGRKRKRPTDGLHGRALERWDGRGGVQESKNDAFTHACDGQTVECPSVRSEPASRPSLTTMFLCMMKNFKWTDPWHEI